MISPTYELYGSLQLIYSHFNAALFSDQLPNVIFTTQRKKNVAGHFSHNRWLSNNGVTCHEISINPQYIAGSSLVELLQTMVHEMCHLQQYTKGKPSRNGYHNKEFAKMMIDAGLMPSTTGRPGGAKTGQNMSDYPLPGGKFIQACEQLIRDHNFTLTWADRYSAYSLQKNDSTLEEDLPEWSLNMDVGIASVLAGDAVGLFEGDFAEISNVSSQNTKTAYQCPSCTLRAWGGRSLKLLCMHCNEEMIKAVKEN